MSSRPDTAALDVRAPEVERRRGRFRARHYIDMKMRPRPAATARDLARIHRATAAPLGQFAGGVSVDPGFRYADAARR